MLGFRFLRIMVRNRVTDRVRGRIRVRDRGRVRVRVRVRDRVRFRDRNRRSEAINFGAIQIADLNLTPCKIKGGVFL